VNQTEFKLVRAFCFWPRPVLPDPLPSFTPKRFAYFGKTMVPRCSMSCSCEPSSRPWPPFS